MRRFFCSYARKLDFLATWPTCPQGLQPDEFQTITEAISRFLGVEFKLI